ILLRHRVRHEVLLRQALPVPPLDPVSRAQQPSQKRKACVVSRHRIQRSPLPAVLSPLQELGLTQVSFCFFDCSTADACEDEFVPEFVGGFEFFGALTSMIAASNAAASGSARSSACS